MKSKKFKLEIMLTEPMLGTVPKDKEIYKTYIASKAPDKEGADEVESVEEAEVKGWTGFHRVPGEGGMPFIYNYMIKGFMKAAGNTLKEQLKIKALKSKLDQFLFVSPRQIMLPEIDKEPLERPLRAMTPKGPIVSLARSDTVAAGTVLECELLLLDHKEIKEQTLRDLLDYGALKGLGQWRNADYGQFTYTLTRIEEAGEK